MIEKVNPCHPDKVADRIAGAIVDLAYTKNANPKCAVEVLIGHGICHIIAETSENITYPEVARIVHRIAGDVETDLQVVPQDVYLSKNQEGKIRCGDNGIFMGLPPTDEERYLSLVARGIYSKYKSDGKYILADGNLIICQSNASTQELKETYPNAIVNPLGDWTGGTCVDSGATNRKLGSDMGHAVTGGGLHGKDLSKADVSINIYAFLKAKACSRPIELYCAIGDVIVDGKSYTDIVEIARKFIKEVGGFEKFAEWGLF